jgi:NADPH:quinone reductase-like Zn-dependent oxidoreductase
MSPLAREFGGYVIGTGRAADRQKALDFGAQEFVDLDSDALGDVGEVDLVFDVIGGEIQKRSAGLVRVGASPCVLASAGAPARTLNGLSFQWSEREDQAAKRTTEVVSARQEHATARM